MELWDIYDENKQPTGRTMKRNDWHMKPGEFHLTVLGVIARPDGTFLVTKRVMTKAWAPGWWEVSGGAAQAGESSWEAVRREVREETGLDVSKADGGYLFTYRRINPDEGDNYFVDVYRFVMDVKDEDLHLQEEETDGYRFAALDEIKGYAAEGKFRFGDMFLWNFNRISYISDLHLMHRIKNAGCKSKEDVVFTIKKIIDDILAESTSLTLIGGDVSSEFSIFELFVKMLRKLAGSGRRTFVFVLGNHELWNFPGLSVDEIVDKYRTVLKENGMYLLHNDLFYRNESDDMGIIPYDELIQSDNPAILEKLRCTRLVILGGLGFSGYNEEFNANDGVYRATVDRNTEIQESKKFEQLYDKLTDVLAKKNTVIFTHTPKKDWCVDAKCHDNFVYVSGHTHRNMFFDDGVKRIYADNQIGYRNESPHLKSFLMDGEYDYFCNYEDGIYEITSQEYQDFSRGKNISMTFNRQVNILYMLKKNGYYCFIHKTKTGSLSMLNGGALKKLNTKDVNYYYDNMDSMIAFIETPLKKYTAYQESIADEIRKIGGSGWIHGCIIDIDYYNHVYVNPVDMTVRSYWASDIVNKLVYPTVPALLKNECPELYANYLKLIEGEKSNPLAVKQTKNEVSLLPQEYLETDIYKASREIKKMQKLNSNVLTTWYDIVPERNELPCKKLVSNKE